MRINDESVYDASKHIDLEISPEDIRKGKGKDPGACAIAQACLREIENVTAARVHLSRTYIRVKDQKTGKHEWIRFQTPKSLRSEIIAFDRGGSFEPGNHRLIPIKPSIKLGTRKPKTKRNGTHPQRGRRKMHKVENVRASGTNR